MKDEQTRTAMRDMERDRKRRRKEARRILKEIKHRDERERLDAIEGFLARPQATVTERELKP